MKLKRSTAAWLAASLLFGGMTLFVASASGDDPISAGLIYFAVWASAITTALCVAGLVVTILR